MALKRWSSCERRARRLATVLHVVALFVLKPLTSPRGQFLPSSFNFLDRLPLFGLDNVGREPATLVGISKILFNQLHPGLPRSGRVGQSVTERVQLQTGSLMQRRAD